MADGKGSLRVGCSGWSYPDWRGVFYPRKVQPAGFLASYASRFPVVEVNSTFYQVPPPSIVAKWAKETPDEFSFTAKIHGGISHARLPGVADAGAWLSLQEECASFARALAMLGAKLESLLLQFPPHVRATKSMQPRVEVLISAIMNAIRTTPGIDPWLAIEFRHNSWFQAAPVIESISSTDNVVIAGSIHPAVNPFFKTTGNTYYFRFIGDRSITSFGKLVRDRQMEMSLVADELEKKVQDGIDTLVLVNNHYAGFGPGSANMLRAMVGQPAVPFLPLEEGQSRLSDFT